MIRRPAHSALLGVLILASAPARADPQYVLGGKTPTIFDKLIGPYGWKDEGATIEARLTGNSKVTAEKIADWAFCDCVDPVSRDAIRGVAVMPAGSKIDLVNAVAGYVLNENPDPSGLFPAVVASLGIAVAGADHTKSWGANFVFADGKGRKISDGRDREGYVMEADASITSPDTTVTGLLFDGRAIVQPKRATVLTIANLDGKGGKTAKWTYGLFSLDGATDTFAHIGAAMGAPGNSSQALEMGFYRPDGVGRVIKFQAADVAGYSTLKVFSPASAAVLDVDGGFGTAGVKGVSCEGPPTSRYRVQGGIVTSC